MSSLRSRRGGISTGKTLRRSNKSLRKEPVPMAASKSRFVATITRASEQIRRLAADSFKFALLQKTQESYLGFGRKFSDSVQEDGAGRDRVEMCLCAESRTRGRSSYLVYVRSGVPNPQTSRLSRSLSLVEFSLSAQNAAPAVSVNAGEEIYPLLRNDIRDQAGARFRHSPKSRLSLEKDQVFPSFIRSWSKTTSSKKISAFRTFGRHRLNRRQNCHSPGCSGNLVG